MAIRLNCLYECKLAIKLKRYSPFQAHREAGLSSLGLVSLYHLTAVHQSETDSQISHHTWLYLPAGEAKQTITVW